MDVDVVSRVKYFVKALTSNTKIYFFVRNFIMPNHRNMINVWQIIIILFLPQTTCSNKILNLFAKTAFSRIHSYNFNFFIANLFRNQVKSQKLSLIELLTILWKILWKNRKQKNPIVLKWWSGEDSSFALFFGQDKWGWCKAPCEWQFL